MAGKTNTKKITGFLFKTVLTRSVLTGALLGLAMVLTGFAVEEELAMFGFIGLAALVFAAAVVIGILIGLIKGMLFRRSVSKQEAGGLPFDSDSLRKIAEDGSVYLGERWLALRNRNSYRVYAKERIAEVEYAGSFAPNAPTRWMRIKPVNGTAMAYRYPAGEPDITKTVQTWIRGEEEAALAKTVTPGTCPYCTGPNPADAKVCQWCGSALPPESPAPAAPLTAPAAAVNEPFIRRSIPEDAHPTSKGTLITIAILSIILLALVVFLFFA